MPLNFEFKAKSANNALLEERLKNLDPQFVGEDLQIDTYFHCATGRLKLREGHIENALIHYERIDHAGVKQSNVLLYQYQPDKTLKAVLTAALGIKIVVEKRRRIWFIDNVKFHFDQVAQSGEFVEVEAIDKDGTVGINRLKAQCNFYASFFGVKEDDYLAASYSDLLLQQTMS